MKITFATTIALLGVAAPAMAAKPSERRLHTDAVDASSFLTNDWNRFQENYHPNYVGDDDPKTAWTEGAKNSGAGEWVRLRVTELADTTKVRLKIRNGYQKSPKLFTANARAKQVTLKLLPSGTSRKLTLADQQGWQEIAIDQPNGPVEGIEIVVDSVYAGTKYDDLCISDIQVFATSKTRENPAFEKAKHKQLLDWKSERVKAAKLFKESAGKELPLLSAYRYDVTEGGDSGDLYEQCQADWTCHGRKALERAAKDREFAKKWSAEITVAQAALGDMAGFIPAKLAPTDKRPIPAVDGVYVPNLYYALEGGWGYGNFELPIVAGIAALRAESLRPLEVKAKQDREAVLGATAPGCKSAKGKRFTWVMRTKAGGRDVTRAVLAVECGRVEVREGTADAAQFQVLVYDSEGKLSLIAGPGYVNGVVWDGTSIASGRSIYADGRTGTLSQGAVAAK